MDEHAVTLTTDDTHYWGSTGGTIVSTSMTNASARGAQWEVLTRDDLLDELSEATPDAPADASFLIQCPGFGRNDTRVSAWNISGDCTNSTLSGGNNTNNCAESFHSPFTISQTLQDAPAGTYALTAQGFYRQDEGRTEQPPVFFIGDNTVPLTSNSHGENSMEDASASFTAKRYTIAPLLFYYDGQRPFTLGIRGTATAQWVVWDNFQLKYLGSDNSTGIQEAVTSQKEQDDTVYDLSGRRVMKPSRGIYIKDGKKIIK